MKFLTEGDILFVSELIPLSAENSKTFRDEVRANLTGGQRVIEVDLSQTLFMDAHGLSALIALHKTATSRNGHVRLINPRPPVQQLLELTRMHRLFEIDKR